jgi:hypothetical protein
MIVSKEGLLASAPDSARLNIINTEAKHMYVPNEFKESEFQTLGGPFNAAGYKPVSYATWQPRFPQPGSLLLQQSLPPKSQRLLSSPPNQNGLLTQAQHQASPQTPVSARLASFDHPGMTSARGENLSAVNVPVGALSPKSAKEVEAPSAQRQSSALNQKSCLKRRSSKDQKVTFDVPEKSDGNALPYGTEMPEPEPEQPWGVIAVDIDDCLLDLRGEFRRYQQDTYPELGYTEDPLLVFNGDVEHPLWRGFMESSVFHDLPEIPGASDALQHLLLAGHRLEAVTMRSPTLLQVTQDNIDRRFPGMISKIHCLGQASDFPGNPPHYNCKGPACQRLGAWLLIDDSFGHVYDVSAHGMSAILLGDSPWNQASTLPPNVVRHTQWQDIAKCIAPFKPGSRVVLVSLTKHEFNNMMTGTCEQYDDERERWQVKLDNGKQVAVREPNLRLDACKEWATQGAAEATVPSDKNAKLVTNLGETPDKHAETHSNKRRNTPRTEHAETHTDKKHLSLEQRVELQGEKLNKLFPNQSFFQRDVRNDMAMTFKVELSEERLNKLSSGQAYIPLYSPSDSNTFDYVNRLSSSNV